MIETAGNKNKTDEGPVSKNRRNRVSSYRKEMIGHSFDSPVVTLLMLIMGLPFLTIITENTIPGALFKLAPMLGLILVLGILSSPPMFGAASVTKRWERYEKAFEDNTPKNDAMSISKLSGYTGINEKQIRSDISWLREYGIIPWGWYKEEKDILYLPDALASKKTETTPENTETVPEKVEAVQEEAPAVPQIDLSQYAEKISGLSKKITDRKMSEKVSVLRGITEKITDYADSYPENAVMPQKLAGYYFPTIIRLLEVYIDLDERHITGKNAEKIKEEICDAMDSASTALDNALEKMLANAEIDTFADIEAMKSKAELDGLLPAQQAAAYHEDTEEGF